jgi:hypothetical protein
LFDPYYIILGFLIAVNVLLCLVLWEPGCTIHQILRVFCCSPQKGTPFKKQTKIGSIKLSFVPGEGYLSLMVK